MKDHDSMKKFYPDGLFQMSLPTIKYQEMLPFSSNISRNPANTHLIGLYQDSNHSLIVNTNYAQSLYQIRNITIQLNISKYITDLIQVFSFAKQTWTSPPFCSSSHSNDSFCKAVVPFTNSKRPEYLYIASTKHSKYL